MRELIPTPFFQISARKVVAASLFLVFSLSACQPGIIAVAPDATPTTGKTIVAPAQLTPSVPSPSQTSPIPVDTSTPTATQGAETQAEKPSEADQQILESSPTASAFTEHTLPPESWQDWPVIPQIPQNVSEIYQKGLALGNDPHAFSILGDCQSLSETFLGIYDTDPDLVSSLPADLQAAVANFSGSFERQSPTIKGGTTAGAVLWANWHENQYTCQSSESPLACELRLHKPSIVIINLGTHYETRNITYLRKILDQLIAQGIVPVLSTKADNRELDGRLNLEMAQLAAEYDLPMWNFWAAVSDLPNHGVGTKSGEEHLGEIYLSDEGLARHRLTALQALSAVWHAVK